MDQTGKRVEIQVSARNLYVADGDGARLEHEQVWITLYQG